MVKIINHSKEKIEQKRKEIEKEIEQNNKSIIKHNFVVVNISITIVISLIVIIIISCIYVPNFINKWLTDSILLACLIAFISFLIAASNLEEPRGSSDYCQIPFEYELFTHNKNILDAQVFSTTLRLTLEDPATHIFTNKEITDFEKIVRTDIEEITVDIVNGKILSPFTLSKGKK